MKRPNRLLSALVAFIGTTSALSAHPGHDGHELTWDLDHLIAHPAATLLCFTAIGAGAYVAYRIARALSEESQDRS